MNAVAYMRVSGKGQEDGDGFERQRLAIERYAAANGITVTAWYNDIQSGRDEWESRPGWSKMVRDLNGNRTILVEKMDRVARAVLVQELIVRDLLHREVRLLTASGDDATDDTPERVMFRQLLGIFAQYERATLTLKLRSARERMRQETGRCEGRKPYGARPGETGTIALMRELRARGESYQAIAVALDARGFTPRNGKIWRPTVIARILAREE
jgi:DNA invertase Pin-like site-specific DNA recombinase